MIIITHPTPQTHSSTLAWKIPWMEEPGWLRSMGSLRVRHDGVTSLSFFTLMHWRRQWQPTPVFLPGKSHGWRSLVGYCPWGGKELGDDWATSLHFIYPCRPFSSPQNSLLFPSETTLSRKSVFHQQFIWGIFHNLHSSASFLKRLYIISPYGHSRTDWARGALTFRWADKALAGVWLKVTQ